MLEIAARALSLVTIVGIGLWIKRLGWVTKEDFGLFARLVLAITLPCALVNGGWYWAVGHDGPVDQSKLMYGQSFALYALAEYATATGDPRALILANETFDAMHRAVDVAHGGFWENLDRAWAPEKTASGRRKSFDMLLGRADELLEGDPGTHRALVDQLAGHALRYGYDWELGGIFREGPPEGQATDTDKEFWQNAEALIGFLHAFEIVGRPEYAEAFSRMWSFCSTHLIHPGLHEWHIRTTRTGGMLDDALGNQWTGGYHTVRAAIECSRRLEIIQEKHPVSTV